ncbi:hypothetical protein [Runella slithyformis]|uniref:Uncharacterized protein n=1 Tax=Runella slithyformis (strain ATCC 29530 / DSM 19594 / LMG 11500 / NCIMB 11436 / LSU 4) TaxID=761193 RepID=A0A7U4E6E5_RUNSL|nr:hypothetical protein [Runella slithyformis]AEI49254.1 hypothetical protein Runsl_2866 [Runella slithyformis DSM 19594]
MLHYTLVSDNKTSEQIAKAINSTKNWLEIKKILHANKLDSKLLPKIISSFILGEIPNERAFEFMRGFKSKHPSFDLGVDPTGKQKYIKIDKLKKKDITKQISDVKQFIPTSQEGWVTFKFGCNPQFKNFDVIVGYAHKSNGNWYYSNLNQQETVQVNNYNSYNNSTTFPINTVKSQGTAFKVFPLTTQDEINDSIETWLKVFPNNNDKVYMYPGYSSYTNFVLSNDSDLTTKIETTDSEILKALAFDLGSTCCPPQ